MSLMQAYRENMLKIFKSTKNKIKV